MTRLYSATLRDYAARLATWPLEEATWKCEQAIRNYEPVHLLRDALPEAESRAGIETCGSDTSPASTHGLGVAEAIELARTLGLLSARLRLYGIVGQDFGFGTDLSPELLPAIGKVVTLVFARASMSTAELREQMLAA